MVQKKPRIVESLQRYSELNLTDHRLNELMVAYRADANDPFKQTATMGLRVQGTGDRAVDTVMRVNQIVINSQSARDFLEWAPYHEYAAHRRDDAMEYGFFDNEDGLYRADNFTHSRLRSTAAFRMETTGRLKAFRWSRSERLRISHGISALSEWAAKSGPFFDPSPCPP